MMKLIVSSLSTLCASASMLKVNPEERLSITELVNQLQEIAAARNVNPKSPVTEVKGPLCLFIYVFIDGQETAFNAGILELWGCVEKRAWMLFPMSVRKDPRESLERGG